LEIDFLSHPLFILFSYLTGDTTKLKFLFCPFFLPGCRICLFFFVVFPEFPLSHNFLGSVTGFLFSLLSPQSKGWAAPPLLSLTLLFVSFLVLLPHKLSFLREVSPLQLFVSRSFSISFQTLPFSQSSPCPSLLPARSFPLILV